MTRDTDPKLITIRRLLEREAKAELRGHQANPKPVSLPAIKMRSLEEIEASWQRK